MSVECDHWAQDCRGGEKCVYYASDGGSAPDSTKCVPVAEDPAEVGEPCVRDPVAWTDDCVFGAMCWEVGVAGEGVCFALCTGSPEMAMCMPGFTCGLFSDGLPHICFAPCDPLMQDCPKAGDVCVWQPAWEFNCMSDASGAEGQAHDPCESANACDPGLMCLPSALAVECDPAVEGCCEPFCDVSAMDDGCPGAGQVCNPWYEPGTAPPGYEKVGYCAVPM